MDSNKSKRVVVYCRVATQAQLDGDHTLEAQSAGCMSRPSGWVMKLWENVSEYENGLRLTRRLERLSEGVEQTADTLLRCGLLHGIARDFRSVW